MRRYPLSALLCIGLLVAACRSDRPPETPPDIRYGEDVCDQCRMIISEARFAAAYVTRQGSVRRFDDIGDMLLFHRQHAEEVVRFWVHDYDSQAWLQAEQALFVRSDNLHTSMGHGVIATRSQERATELATTLTGSVLKFDDLSRQFRVENAAPGPAHRHDTAREKGK